MRGAIVSEKRAIWTADAITIDVTQSTVDVKETTLRPAKAGAPVVVTGWDLEEVARAEVRLDIGLDHANDEPARNAVAGVTHRARRRISEKRLLVHLPHPAWLEDGVHPSRAVGHLDDRDAAPRLHVGLLDHNEAHAGVLSNAYRARLPFRRDESAGEQVVTGETRDRLT